MKQICYFLLSAWVLASLAGCTGYDNGPNMSFVAPEKKMANTWKIQEAVINNREVTSQFEGDFMTFEEDGDFSTLDKNRVVSLPPFTQVDTIDVLGRGSWDFLEKKNRIEQVYTYTFQDPIDQSILYREDQYVQWTIERLTTEEFWLRNETTSLKLIPFEGN